MRGTWKIPVLLVLIWAVAGGVILWTRQSRPTPASLAAYIETHPLESLPAAERGRVIARVAEQLNRLNFDQRQELRKLRADRRFFEQMTPEERKHFLDLTLPEGFRQLMLALNKMTPEQRQKLVRRALDDLERDTPEVRERVDRTAVQKIISQGMDAFYQEASADVKLDFAPVIEKLQRATQGIP
jgi:type IV pilus biogenesis protein CpaD/CtpE